MKAEDIEKEMMFNEWWDLFDKKVGKKAAIAKWAKVDPKHYGKIFRHTPEYVRATPEKHFRMHPATYLYGEHWEDEIISKKPKKSKMETETVEKLNKYG